MPFGFLPLPIPGIGILPFGMMIMAVGILGFLLAGFFAIVFHLGLFFGLAGLFGFLRTVEPSLLNFFVRKQGLYVVRFPIKILNLSSWKLIDEH